MATQDRPVGDLDHDEFRAIGYRTVDLIADYYERIDDRLVYVQADPEDVVAAFDEPLPERGEDPERILDAVEESVIPYATHNPSPRYFGFVMGSGTPLAPLADAIAATVNMNVGGWHPAPSGTEIERRCVRWLAEAIGYAPDTGGLLTSGGTMANFTALMTALRDHTAYETTEAGLQGDHPRYTLYVADHEGHSSVVRAADMLNLGRDAVRRVPSRDDFTMDVDALERLLETDREAGAEPFCVVGQAGSINVSAIDPLRAIADVCAEHECWFHVDGACGAVGAMVPELESRYDGMERADSVTLDPHKWLFVPYECGAVLVHDQECLAKTFAMDASYLRGSVAETPQEFDFYEFGPQLSRGFRALKLWISMKYYGLEGYRELLRTSVRCAEHLDTLVRTHEDFLAVQEPNLFIYSFRYVPGDLQMTLADPPDVPLARVDQYLDELNQAITDEVVRSGLAFLTTTTIRGRRALRMSICSHRTTEADVETVFDALAETGARIDEEWRPKASLPV
ncbi:pyridoxal phosphate-dependent decarboxylase family protein [Natronosalvus caseinilyticus]|uniref:pyridoxal phosphate-dependent decarboxylase family protein n=1 Tax=Natronosalvus caseinilyticus TaxID=2953747 RepID=UPI0028AF1A11|nr:pyridoxal-dependent decarboxylase [Natronosalvus caseinilyticus]